MRDASAAEGALRISSLFPTLVGEALLPGAAPLNRELAAWLRERERSERDVSPLTTVNEGWQSGLDVLDADLSAVRRLRERIDVQIERFLEAWGQASFAPGAPAAFRYSYVGWAVILRPGGFQHEHVHSKTDLVGVYYVEVPPAAPGADVGGLTLVDPRSSRVASRAVWESAQLTLVPEPGKLVIFPSFVPHRVERVSAPGERISINFDVMLQAAA